MIPGSKKNLTLSVVLHAIGLGIFALMLGFAPKPEKVTMIDMIDLGPAPGPEQPVAPPEPAPAPANPEPANPEPQQEPQPPEPPQPPAPPEPKIKEPEPTPTPVKTPEPEAPVKKAEPKPAPPHKVQVSNKKIVRTVAVKPEAAKSTKPASSSGPTFNSSSFAKNLLGKMGNSNGLVTSPTGKGTGLSVNANEFAAYYNLIFQRMYSAWQPPLSADEGLTAPVVIRVEKNGTISKVSLASSSGNNEMDVSAVAAANRVKSLPPLPPGLGTDHADITVNFKIQH